MWNNKEMSELGGTLTSVPLTLTFDLEIVNREREAQLSWNERVVMMPWCETQPLYHLEAEDTVRDRGDLRCRGPRRLV